MVDQNDLSPLSGDWDEEALKATATEEGAGTDETTPMEEEAVTTDNDTATEMDYPQEDK